MAHAGHISDDDLGRYAMGTVEEESELATLEEHLLVCGQCIVRAENTEGYIKAMHTALKASRERR
jgi:hypothetical protein